MHTHETPGRAALDKTTRKVLDSDRHRSDDCIGNESSSRILFNIARILDHSSGSAHFTDTMYHTAYARDITDIAKKLVNGHQVEETTAVNEHRHR